MTNQEPAEKTPVTGEPIDVHAEKARKEKVEKAVREKVQETVEEVGKIVRKKYGPPGTP